MRKLLLLVVLLFQFGLNAQTSIGAGIFQGLDGGSLSALEINSEFVISDGKYSVSPSLDYFMGLSSDYAAGDELASSLIAINVDAHYNMGDMESINYYPLVGILYQMGSYDYPEVDYLGMSAYEENFSNIGFSLGGGLSYVVSDNMKLVGEVKYQIIEDYGGLSILTGILFNIGG